MRHTYRVVMAAAALAGMLATPASAQQDDEAAISFPDTVPPARLVAMVDQGSRLFNGGTCFFCHAVGGRGDGQRAPDLTDEEWLHSMGDFEGIAQTIQWGVKRGEMKAMSPRPHQMNPAGGMKVGFQEIMALTAYVWSRTNGPTPEIVVRQDEVLALLAAGEGRRAADILRSDARAHPDSLMFSERAVNMLGYEYLGRWGEPQTALPLFVINTEIHPDSWNVWDSLAEGYVALGETAKAIENYEKSLALNPRNRGATEALERLRSQ
ncbi:MAG: c-type cytochrome [Gemmatimonadota bacterium]